MDTTCAADQKMSDMTRGQGCVRRGMPDIRRHDPSVLFAGLVAAAWMTLLAACGAESAPEALWIHWDGERGIIDTRGRLRSPPQPFSSTDPFAANGLAPVRRGGLAGYVNVDGEVVIPLRYERAGNFGDSDLAPVEAGGKWAYIDAVGDLVIPYRFEYAEEFSHGLALVRSEGRYGIIGEHGEWVIAAAWEGVASVDDPTLFRVIEGNKWGLVNRQGDVVLSPRYNYISLNGDYPALVKLGDKYGYINRSGNVVIPLQFENARDFAAPGLAGVKVSDRWGFIDSSGELVIPPRYEEADDFHGIGLAPVLEEAGWGFIDIRGELLIPPEYAYARSFTDSGFAPVVKRHAAGVGWGAIDAEGNGITDFRYSALFYLPQHPGLILAFMDENHSGYVDLNGNVVAMAAQRCGRRVLLNSEDEVTWPHDFEAGDCELTEERAKAAEFEAMKMRAIEFLNMKIAGYNEEIGRLDEEVAALGKEKAEIEARIKMRGEKNEDYSEDISRLDEEVAALKKKKAEIEARIKDMRNKINE